MEVFDKIRADAIADRAQLFKDIASGPFFGANRPGAKVSQGIIDSFWLQSAKLVRNATLKIYAGAPHGLADTHKDQLNGDLLAFLGAASTQLPA